MFQLLLMFVIGLCHADSRLFQERKQFHERICQKKPELKTCSVPFTEETYTKELEKYATEQNLKKIGASTHRTHSFFKASPTWWASSEEQDDYEYYLWRKYQRIKYRRRHAYDRMPTQEVHNHYHYEQRPTYSYPAYSYGTTYPGYYSSYPSYGYGGGYGGAGIFNMGFGRQLGISTPIGGFGISSGFGIGIG